MNKREAKAILADAMGKYRARNYADLLYLLATQDVTEVMTGKGIRYQLEIQAVWDDQANGNLRIIGAIDDGGLSAFLPLTEDFIIAPDGRFIGE